jgi:hypothetical protein
MAVANHIHAHAAAAYLAADESKAVPLRLLGELAATTAQV